MTEKEHTVRHYRDGRGNTCFVTAGLSGGAWYFPAFQKANEALKRVKSPALPQRPTEATAQADLDAYALSRGWEEVAW